MGNANANNSFPESSSNQTCNFMHNKCFQNGGSQSSFQSNEISENYNSEPKNPAPVNPEHNLPNYFYVHHSKSQASKQKFAKKKRDQEKSAHHLDSDSTFKNTNFYANAKPETLYEQYLFKFYENSSLDRTSSKENMFVPKNLAPMNGETDFSKMYAEPFTLKEFNSKISENFDVSQNFDVYKTRTESEKKSNAKLFTFEDEIQPSHQKYEKSGIPFEVSGGSSFQNYSTKLESPPEIKEKLYTFDDYKPYYQTSSPYNYSDQSNSQHKNLYEPQNYTVKVEASFSSPYKEGTPVSLEKPSIGLSQYTYDNKQESQKKKILPNPFLKVETLDNTMTKELKQETPRCLYMNKGKMTPKANENMTFSFRPMESTNTFEVSKKDFLYEKPNEKVIANDNYPPNDKYPQYNNNFSSYSNYKPYDFEKNEFHKPSSSLMNSEVIDHNMSDITKKTYVPINNTIIDDKLYSPMENYSIFSPDHFKPFDFEKTSIAPPTLVNSQFINDHHENDKNTYIPKNYNEPSYQQKNDFTYKPILDFNKNSPSKFSPEKKVKINVLPPLFKHESPIEMELGNNNDNDHLSNLLKKASDIITEANEEKMKSEYTLKSEKLFADVIDLLKKSNYVQTSIENSPMHDVNAILGVRQVVSIPFKQQKILKSSTSINGKNWDFPYTRSISLNGTENDSVIFKEDFLKDINRGNKNDEKTSKPENSEKKSEPLTKELSMHDLPSIFSDNNEKQMVASHPNANIVKMISSEENDIAKRKKSKSLDSPLINNTLLNSEHHNLDLSSQKLEKVQCEIGSQSEINEIPENQQILSLDDDFLKMAKLEEKQQVEMKKINRVSCPTRNSMNAFRDSNSNLNLEIEKINDREENKPKSKSDFVKITRISVDYENNSEGSKVQNFDPRASQKQSFDESKIIVFEEANLPPVSWQGESLSEIEEEKNEFKGKESIDVARKAKGINYFKKLRNLRKQRKNKEYLEEKTLEEKKNMMKWISFEPLKRKGKKLYANIREQNRKKRAELQIEEKWGNFLHRYKRKKKYFSKLKGQNKAKNHEKTTHQEKDESFEEEPKNHNKRNYFSLLRQKRAEEKRIKVEKEEENHLEKKQENWDKFSPMIRKKKNQMKMRIFKDEKNQSKSNKKEKNHDEGNYEIGTLREEEEKLINEDNNEQFTVKEEHIEELKKNETKNEQNEENVSQKSHSDSNENENPLVLLDSPTKNTPKKNEESSSRRGTEDFPDYIYDSLDRRSTFRFSNADIVKVPLPFEVSQLTSQENPHIEGQTTSCLDFIAPMQPKIAMISHASQKKIEVSDSAYESTLSQNMQTTYESLEIKQKSPDKNKKFSRLGKYAEIALNLEEVLAFKKEPPIPKIDKYRKLGKYAEVAFNLERLFSGRPRKSSSQGSDDSKDPSKKKRISFEDFLRQKSTDLDKKENSNELYHVKMDSPVNLPQRRKKQEKRNYEFEI